MADEDFCGAFHSVMWAVERDASIRSAVVGRALIDPGGSAVDTWELINSDGVAAIGSWPLTEAWAGWSDGDFECSLLPAGYGFAGGMGGKGDLLLTAGSTTGGQGPGILLFLRRSADRTVADFTGSYYAAGFTWHASDGHYRGYAGTLSSNGEGNYQRTLRVNDEGAVGLGAPVGNTYDVDADGGLALDMGTVGTWLGALSATGDIAVLGGGAVTDEPVGIFLLLRR